MSGTGTVGVIGLGVMGSAMSSHLLRAGLDVVGLDVDPERMRAHRAAGGRTVSSAREMAGECGVIISSLPNAEALLDVLTRPDGVRAAGQPVTVIETSTLSPDEKRRASEAAGPRVLLLDCPLSGTGQQARDGDLIAYLSGGTTADREAVLPILSHTTRACYDLGEFGNGTRMKVVANLLVAVHNAAAAEALLLAQRSGLDLGQVLTAIGDGAGSSRMFEIRGPMMVAGGFENATMRVDTFQKDLRIIADFAASVASPTPLLAVTAVLYQAAVAQGRSHQDTASVFAVLRGLTGD
ncbi:NAD(P)-dependent oxidoreductase [Microbispora sp. H10836]|uniref:NAD(P)-dependent oxidoreductase n=1 Tax=Microbispora sp. H10836 TaxID=2729106 RepID=UPI00147388F5|nr:NAD(P)-dependent oxidoreductase [Microbispora sp. H10836]